MGTMADSPPADATTGLLGDDPVDDEGRDLLRRGAFAARVTELIDHVAQETPSAVLALLGPWGSGKTTVLHFVRQRLKTQERWRAAEFNPWMVSDLPSLVQAFFTTLREALPDDPNSKLRVKMAGYAKAVSPFAAPFKLFGIDAQRAAEAAAEVLAGDQSIEARRGELEEALRTHDKPVLLVADDLDRLHPDELMLFFKLVRLVGRLPKVYYLLAFDEETVLDVVQSTALAGGDRSRALAYLEKVVQIRLDLPPVHPRLSENLLDELLDALIAKYGVTLDDGAAHRLSDAYHTHLAAYLREPRQVKRYCAQIEAFYPLVALEVDFVDFAIITFLRTFHPGVTTLLAAHKAELTGTSLDEIINKPNHEERSRTWREHLSQAGVGEGDLSAIMQLLGQLFLPIKGALERTEYASGFYPELAARRRVGSSEYFDRYFHLAIGPDDLSDATVAAALSEVLGGTPGDDWSTVMELLPTNPQLVFDKLRRLAPPTSDAALHLLPVLAPIAEQVPDNSFLGGGFLHRLWAAELLLLAEPPDPRAFAEQLERVGSVHFLADSCARAKARVDEEHPASPCFDLLCKEAVRLIQEELDQQAALPPEDTSGVRSLLDYWGMLDPDADRQTWTRSIIESGTWPLPDVLAIFVPVGTSTAGYGRTWRSLGDTQLKLLDDVIGLRYVAERLECPSGPFDETSVEDSDVSWGARVQRAALAVARWDAANKPTQEPAADTDNGESL